MRLHNLQPKKGSKHRSKRLGAGESSGKGKTSGRGHKGQKARAGGSVRPGFEGGQMPLFRRLPKRGFNNSAFAKQFAEVNLESLNRFDDGAKVDEEALRAGGLVRGRVDGIKILARGELEKKLEVEADRFSAAARDKIEKAGGKALVRPAKATPAAAQTTGGEK